MIDIRGQQDGARPIDETTEPAPRQAALSPDQVRAFYHDEFVEDQARHFLALLPQSARPGAVVLDVGGGCGFFARRLGELTGATVRVLDADPLSIEACRRAGVDAVLGDALRPPARGDEDVVCFNLVLHHLVGESEPATRELQLAALRAWRPRVRSVFVNEYIYESFLRGFSSRLIYEITSSQLLSGIARAVARFVPALRANTFGVGVRFRSHAGWSRLFSEAGFDVGATEVGRHESVRLPLRLMLIREIRRDSFRLDPRDPGV